MNNLDFIVVGFKKCGTTSLFEYLRRHPQVFMPAEKELEFDGNVDTLMDRYYYNAPEDKLWGHATPSFCQNLFMVRLCKRSFPNAKIILITRNVEEQKYSHWKWDHDVRKLETRPYEECKNDDRYIEASNYNKYIDAYKEAYGEENVFVANLGSLKALPEIVMHQIHSFLGIDYFVARNLGKVYNASNHKMARIWDALKHYFPLIGFIGKFVPERWKGKIDTFIRIRLGF